MVALPDLALISPYPPPGERHGGPSGVASYSANLAQALAAAGLDVVVLADRTAAATRPWRDGPVLVWPVWRPGSRAVWTAARAAVSSGAPVTHVQHEVFLYGGPASVPALAPALLLLRGRMRRTVVTMHQVVDVGAIDEAFTERHRVAVPPLAAKVALGTVQASVRRLADEVIVHERPFADVVAGAQVVPHGIEAVPRQAPGVARRRLGLSADRFVALCFGFLAPYKGLELAGRAAQRLSEGVDVVVAGGAHPRLEAAGDRYAEQLRDDYGGAVRFVGYVPDDDVHDWFDAADVVLFLYPEPFSSSGALALALAHHRPILLSEAMGRSVGAPEEAVVPLDDVALARRLEQLRDDPSQLAELAEAATSLAAERAWSTVARRHRDVYHVA